MYNVMHPTTGRVMLAGTSLAAVIDPRYPEKTRILQYRAPMPVGKSLLFVQASDGEPSLSPRGALPKQDEIAAWEGNFDWVVVMHHHLYYDNPNGNASPPYNPLRPYSLKRFNANCLEHNIISLAYVSPFNFARISGRKPNWDFFYKHCQGLLMAYGYRGFYVDGLLFDYHNKVHDDPVKSVEIASRLRDLIGDRGAMIGHLSHGNLPASFWPDLDKKFDAVIRGEGYSVTDINNPYLNNEIATTGWTGIPTGWLYHDSSRDLADKIGIDGLMEYQVTHGMIGISFAQQTIENNRYHWSDGRTSYWKAWNHQYELVSAMGAFRL